MRRNSLVLGISIVAFHLSAAQADDGNSLKAVIEQKRQQMSKSAARTEKPAPAKPEFVVAIEIGGLGSTLMATVRYQDGTTTPVLSPGDKLPTGETITEILPAIILVKRTGHSKPTALEIGER